MKDSISKFAPGVFIIILGIGLVGFGSSSGQNSVFLIAGISIVIAGAITILNALGKISNKIAMGIATVLLLLSGYLAYANYHSIDEPIQFMRKKQMIYVEVIQNLKDLRQVELTYKKENKVFCGNMDTLMDFLKNDSVRMVKMYGDVPDTLTETEALEQGIIRRDTTIHPAMDIVFNNDYLKTRDKKQTLNIETLRYVPHSDNVDFSVQAGEITRLSGAKVQVFEIIDAAPFDETDVMKVGSMIDPSTSGNWKEEK
jgi:membrane-bound ClpP family serine protease